VINPRLMADAVEARARTVANAHGYVLEAGDVPRVEGGDGRVEPYWVLTVSPGAPTPEQDVAATVDDLDWLIQFTVAGGWAADVQDLAARLHASLYRWAPTVAGVVCGPLAPPPGYLPLIQLDRQFTPHRPFVPLQYVSRNTVT